MGLKELLLDAPLYKLVDIDSDVPNHLPYPRINIYCPACREESTHIPYEEQDQVAFATEWSNTSLQGRVQLLPYSCGQCQQVLSYFLIQYPTDAPFKARKIGQYPSWKQRDRNLARNTMGIFSENYLRGFTAESMGWGIAACAYYRRIIEDVMDYILEAYLSTLDETDRVAFQSQIDIANTGRIAEAKINLAIKASPPTLLDDGENPLALAYDALSVGIHRSTEEEALGYAALARQMLDFIVRQVSFMDDFKKRRQEYVAATKQLRQAIKGKTR